MKRFYTLLGLLLLAYSSVAQSWLWGRSGGSSDYPGYPETVIDMATDNNGNIYLLANVLQTNLNIDGHSKTGYGLQDMMLSSFSASGVYRWSKVFGGYTNDMPKALRADSLGHIYVAGSIYSPSNPLLTAVHFDADTTLANNCKRNLFLIQYDTLGNYKWLRLPQPDTLSLTNAVDSSKTIDMNVDAAGNVYWLCQLPAGGFADGSFTVPGTGLYMLKYDKSGVFKLSFPLQMTATGSVLDNIHMQRDPLTGRFYLAGGLTGGSIQFLGNPVAHPTFLATLDSTGNFLWKKEGKAYTAYGGCSGRPAIDSACNIYLTGTTSLWDSLNGQALSDSIAGPFVIKMDSAGHNVWTVHPTVNYTTFGNALTLLSNTQLVMTGAYAGLLRWTGYTPALYHSPGLGFGVFFTHFNALTGAVIGMDSLSGDLGYNSYPASIEADHKGGFFIGGQFEDIINVAGDMLQTTGGETDFFVAKYCYANCSIAPSSIDHTPIAAANTLSIYPNPAIGVLHIDAVTDNTSYRLYSIVGCTLQSGSLHTGNNMLNVQDIPAGIYLLEMTDINGNRHISRIVKE
ncbi:MAG: T9SS type A sorting domain-containing protein [Bacteroidota bacterium]